MTAQSSGPRGNPRALGSSRRDGNNTQARLQPDARRLRARTTAAAVLLAAVVADMLQPSCRCAQLSLLTRVALRRAAASGVPPHTCLDATDLCEPFYTWTLLCSECGEERSVFINELAPLSNSDRSLVRAVCACGWRSAVDR